MARRRLLGKTNGTILGFLSHNSPVPLLGSKFFVFIIAVRVRSRSTTMDYNVFGAERAVTAPSRQRQTNPGSASIISPFGLLPTAVHNWTEVLFCLFSPSLFVCPLFPFSFFFLWKLYLALLDGSELGRSRKFSLLRLGRHVSCRAEIPTWSGARDIIS